MEIIKSGINGAMSGFQVVVNTGDRNVHLLFSPSRELGLILDAVGENAVLYNFVDTQEESFLTLPTKEPMLAFKADQFPTAESYYLRVLGMELSVGLSLTQDSVDDIFSFTKFFIDYPEKFEEFKHPNGGE